MFQRLYSCRTRRQIAKLITIGVRGHLDELYASKVRVHSLIEVYENFLSTEPQEIDTLPEGKELTASLKDLPEINFVWKKWHLWANKFNNNLKDEVGVFAQKIHDSRAIDHSINNRRTLNSILDTTFTSALWLRTGSSLVYNYVNIKDRHEVSECDIISLIKKSISSFYDLSRSLCGANISVEFRNLTNLREINIIGVESQLRFVIVELLENAAKSLIKRHGVLSLEDKAPLIELIIEREPDSLLIRIRDRGRGMTGKELILARGYFYTTDDVSQQKLTLDSFGKPFAGIGFGIPRARVYLSFNGGRLRHKSLGPGHGTEAQIRFENSCFLPT